jgi:hypothetical protein
MARVDGTFGEVLIDRWPPGLERRFGDVSGFTPKLAVTVDIKDPQLGAGRNGERE